MTRVKVFIDYQNVYHRARQAFETPQCHPIKGHVRPLRLGVLVKQMRETHDPERQLVEVRAYRGEPTNKSHPKVQAGFQRQVTAWRTREPHLVTITRPLRYTPTKWRRGKAVEWDTGEEKGIDVLIALDLALGAERDEYDVAVLCSSDTDLEPALDSVIESGKQVENAIWKPDDGYARPLKSTKTKIWLHYLGRKHYDWLHDPTDYTVEQGDVNAL